MTYFNLESHVLRVGKIFSLIIPSPIFSVISFRNSYFLGVGLSRFICQLNFFPPFSIYPFIYFLGCFLNVLLQPLKLPAVPILWIEHYLSPPWRILRICWKLFQLLHLSLMSLSFFFPSVSVFHVSSIPEMAVPCRSQVWKCWYPVWWVCFVTIVYIWGLAT